jgi:ceramide glucosyltransferase
VASLCYPSKLIVTYVFLVAAVIALGYQIVALIAAFHQMLREERPGEWTPPVSILKPVRGLDPHFYESIRSHAMQSYPEFEILFGVAESDDPAIPVVEDLIAEFPGCRIQLIRCADDAPNRKTAVLKSLAAAASYPILLVNDSDITVSTTYLREVVAPLEDREIGVVTCLYRGAADSWPGMGEALGIATDFAVSVLVAPLVGVREFGLGSTLVFRAEQLMEIGGFASIQDYLADDYYLSRRITELGYRVHLSKTVVDTTLGAGSLADVWRHQVRWHRTIRVSKGIAYFGITVTQATLWGLAAVASGWWQVGLATLAGRVATGLVAGVGVLHCPVAGRWFWLMPLRDLFGVAVWVAGLAGNTVEWRGRSLRLTPDGRIRK